MPGRPLEGPGLRGQVAGTTSLCTVGKTGSGLNYRGYDIEVLAQKARFEEVAHLLLKGQLPTQSQLDEYKGQTQGPSRAAIGIARSAGKDPCRRPSHGCDANPAVRCLAISNSKAISRARTKWRTGCWRRCLRSFATGMSGVITADASKPPSTAIPSALISSICCTVRRPTNCFGR